MKEAQLISIARQVRKDILTMAYNAQAAHTGGALSTVEIMVSLYFEIMHIYPKKPHHPQRDRLIFSKGHDAKVLYSVLCRRGFFPEKLLTGYEKDRGLLHGHSTKYIVPGIEVSTGSLGHGLSLACGMAYAAKLDKKKHRVFVILSDGECDEGSVWEAVLFAGHHKLSNLVAIVDYNKLQGYGHTREILELEPFAAKWRAFHWAAKEIDGHDFPAIIRTLKKAPFVMDMPSVIIAHTIKGKGGVVKHVNQVSSQYKSPTRDEWEELVGSKKEL